jgi:arabinan endo-1,5-alpha-L-arabinosidase
VQAPSASRWVPYVDGAFERVFRPEGSRYLNDHSLIRGADGRWHLYGITDDSSGMPHAERSLLHATAASLRGPWSEEPDVLMTIGAEQVLWAPFVFPTEPGRWLMYFWAGTPDGRTQRAESTDLFRWTRSPRSAPGGRDPFVLRVGSEWFLYSVGVSEPVGAMAHGQILVTRSDDLEHWSTPSLAATEGQQGDAEGVSGGRHSGISSFARSGGAALRAPIGGHWGVLRVGEEELVARGARCETGREQEGEREDAP